MSRYRRVKIEGGLFFFTLTLADRSSDLLVRHIERLRRAYKVTQQRFPFETVAICILPDHLHAVCLLPDGDSDFSARWSLFKSDFSRGLPAAQSRSASKIKKARKGNLATTLLGTRDPRRSRFGAPRQLHPLQSRQARACVAGCRLAALQLPPLCGARSLARGLGWRHNGHRRQFR